MRLTSRAPIAILILVAIFLVTPQPCFACACRTGPDPTRVAEFLASSTAVFAGQVIAVTDLPGTVPFAGGVSQRATFRVATRWQGPANPELVVLSGGMCGHHFRVGEAWLIFAYTYPAEPYQGEFTTYECRGNVAFAVTDPAIVQDYLLALGPGVLVESPPPAYLPRAGAGGGRLWQPTWYHWLAAAGGALFATSGAAARRKAGWRGTPRC